MNAEGYLPHRFRSAEGNLLLTASTSRPSGNPLKRFGLLSVVCLPHSYLSADLSAGVRFLNEGGSCFLYVGGKLWAIPRFCPLNESIYDPLRGRRPVGSRRPSFLAGDEFDPSASSSASVCFTCFTPGVSHCKTASSQRHVHPR